VEQGFDGKIDIEVGPVEMMGRGPLNVSSLAIGASRNHGKSSNGRKTSVSSRRSQKPSSETLATSTAEAVFPVEDVIFVLLNRVEDRCAGSMIWFLCHRILRRLLGGENNNAGIMPALLFE
jgi:hypothetical protein